MWVLLVIAEEGVYSFDDAAAVRLDGSGDEV